MGRISACIVVYNEEMLIARCLDSIKDVVDEIIIVHDGVCTDNTLKIAKKYGAKIFVRKHIGDAEPHRNFSFSKAKFDWILQIDADELLSENLKKSIKNLVINPKYDAYAFKWDFYCQKNKHVYEYKLALFRKSRMLPFYGIPHESVRVNGNIKKSDLELVHKPAIQYYTMNFLKVKIRWTKIQARYLVKKKLVKFPYPIYFFKAIFWFFAYFFLTAIKYHDIRISFFAAIYNFLVWWHVFIYKLRIFHNLI